MSENNSNRNDGTTHLPSKPETGSGEEDDAHPKSMNRTEATNGSAKAGSIAAILKSSGPVVKCVLLKHMRSSGRDVHPHLDKSVIAPKLHQYTASISTGSSDENPKPAATDKTDASPEHHHHHREVLTELIEELEIDTTPGKNDVQKVFDGNTFTFVGQYPDEGVVLMARGDQFHDIDVIDTLSIPELKEFIQESNINIDLTTIVDKWELVQAVKDAQLPLNPHRLQPPFHDCPIRGDILLMRISTDEEEDDDDDDTEEDAAAKTSAIIGKAIQDITTATAKPNDEFFLDYTKDEYIAFASRTDIVAIDDDDDDDGDGCDYEEEKGENDEGDEDDDEEGEGEEKDDEDDDEEEGEDEEEDKHLLLNLILTEVIKSFRKDNGRGPDSEELLDLRSRIAEQLNLTLPPPASPIPEGDRKRKTIDDHNDEHHDDNHSTSPSPKKVKFDPDIIEKAEENDNDIDDGTTADDETDKALKVEEDDADDSKREGTTTDNFSPYLDYI